MKNKIVVRKNHLEWGFGKVVDLTKTHYLKVNFFNDKRCYNVHIDELKVIENITDVKWSVMLEPHEIKETLQFLEDNTDILWNSKDKPTEIKFSHFQYKYLRLEFDYFDNKRLTKSSRDIKTWENGGYKIENFLTLKTIINDILTKKTISRRCSDGGTIIEQGLKQIEFARFSKQYKSFSTNRETELCKSSIRRGNLLG